MALRRRSKAQQRTDSLTLISELLIGGSVINISRIELACPSIEFRKIVLLVTQVIGSARVHRWTLHTDPAVFSYEAPKSWQDQLPSNALALPASAAHEIDMPGIQRRHPGWCGAEYSQGDALKVEARAVEKLKVGQCFIPPTSSETTDCPSLAAGVERRRRAALSGATANVGGAEKITLANGTAERRALADHA